MAKLLLAAAGGGAPRLLQAAGILALLGLALFAVDLSGQHSRWQRPAPSSAGGAAASGAAAAGIKSEGGDARIPKILHRVFLSGRENFDTLHNNPASTIKVRVRGRVCGLARPGVGRVGRPPVLR